MWEAGGGNVAISEAITAKNKVLNYAGIMKLWNKAGSEAAGETGPRLRVEYEFYNIKWHLNWPFLPTVSIAEWVLREY